MARPLSPVASGMPFGGPLDWLQLAIVTVFTCFMLAVLVRLARGTRWMDDGADAPERKHRGASVPLVGGPALAIAAALRCLWPHFADAGALGNTNALVPWIPADPWSFEPRLFVLALALSFATGLVDDVRTKGLGPAQKLVGQLAAGVALALALRTPEHLDGAPLALGVLVVVLAVVAQNVANAFDHADGALGSVAFAAFASAGSSFAGALAAFLGFNLTRRARGGSPHAFLGDSGSHALGLLLATSSVGQAALTLPALDLVRVLVLRARAGQPVWRGDARHLGQRLRAAGRGPLPTVGLVLLCAAPAFVALAFAMREPEIVRGAAAALGALGCAVLLGIVLRMHPDPAT